MKQNILKIFSNKVIEVEAVMNESLSKYLENYLEINLQRFLNNLDF